MSGIFNQVGFLSLCLMASAVVLPGQSEPTSSGDTGRVADSRHPLDAAPERCVSWIGLPRNLLADQKRVWTFPLRAARGKDWKPTLAVVAAAGALIALDPHDAPYFRRTSSFTVFNQTFSGRNTMLGMVILPASVYVAGLEKRDTYAQHTALLAGEAAADTAIVAWVMKDAFHRVRPSDISPNGNFFDSWFEARGSLLGKNASFPSGHTIEAFSIATVFAERYRKHRWVPWVSYGLATVVGFSRISLQAHFPSDVFVGAALGYFISHDVVLRVH